MGASVVALPGQGIEPVSPALAGRFSTTAPPGKPVSQLYFNLKKKEEEKKVAEFLVYCIFTVIYPT